MLVLFLNLLNISLVSLGFGLLFNHLTRLKNISVIQTMIHGFIVSIALAQWISLFAPVNSTINLIFSIISAGWIMLYGRKVLTINRLSLFNPLIPGLIILLLHSIIMMNAFPVLPDTWFYHSQSVKWIEEYGVVKGLGNFFSNLGYNSSLFVGNALYSPRWLLGYPAFPLNGFIWLLALLRMMQRSNALLKAGNSLLFVLEWAVLLTIYRFFHSSLSSSGQDPAAALFLFILYCEVRSVSASAESGRLSLILISSFLISLKLSHALFLIPALVWAWGMKAIPKKAMALIIIGFVVFPYLGRNLILTGYLLYPFPYPDIFPFDWKIPFADVLFEQNLIRSWASDPALPLDGNQQYFAFQWFRLWFVNLGIFSVILFILLLISGLSLLIRRLRQQLLQSGLALFYAFIWASIILWFFSAPSPRFIITMLLLGISIPLQFLLIPFEKQIHNKYLPVVFFYLFLVFSFSAARFTTGEALSRQGSFLAPLPPPEPRVRTEQINNVGFHYIDPKDLKAYDHALPTGPQYRKGLMLRGNGLKQGFKTDSSQRMGGSAEIMHFYESRPLKGDTLR